MSKVNLQNIIGCVNVRICLVYTITCTAFSITISSNRGYDFVSTTRRNTCKFQRFYRMLNNKLSDFLQASYKSSFLGRFPFFKYL